MVLMVFRVLLVAVFDLDRFSIEIRSKFNLPQKTGLPVYPIFLDFLELNGNYNGT